MYGIIISLKISQHLTCFEGMQEVALLPRCRSNIWCKNLMTLWRTSMNGFLVVSSFVFAFASRSNFCLKITTVIQEALEKQSDITEGMYLYFHIWNKLRFSRPFLGYGLRKSIITKTWYKCTYTFAVWYHEEKLQLFS